MRPFSVPGTLFGPSPPPRRPTGDRTVGRYLVAVLVTVVAIVSQYFVPALWPASRLVYGSLPGDVAVVYGLPIVAFALLVGAGPLRNWRAGTRRASVVGVGWYGALGLVAFALLVVGAVVYEVFDPAALQLLKKTNPALQAAAGDPWFYVGFAFVVGAFEETIFRGWIYGFWLRRTTSWLTPAILSSALFAAVHLYYGTTYGSVSPLIFPSLFLTGFAFAATYRSSGGNLVVPAALHGANDAIAYLSLVSLATSTALHWALVLGGAAIALAYYLRWSGTAGGIPSPLPPP